MKLFIVLSLVAFFANEGLGNPQLEIDSPIEAVEIIDILDIPIKNPCVQPLKVGPCKAAINRYYFDVVENKCKLFSWGGCQPNGNNFLTLKECQKVCPVKLGPCEEELKVGPCKAALNRYYFDSVSQQCKLFSWGGCEPNGNNFLTLKSCQKVCRVKLGPCEEELKVGPCKAAFKRFYFNAASQQCELFSWGGCQPNGNNFETIKECQQICPVKKSPCNEERKVGPCKAAINRYFYNSVLQQCELFSWGGCKPNGNNFETIEECQKICPVKKNICNDPLKITGACQQYFEGFTYNSLKKQCEKFADSGCSLTGNNFLTLKECQSTCPVKLIAWDIETKLDVSKLEAM